MPRRVAQLNHQQEGLDIAALELCDRGHACVEDRVRSWNACRLGRPALRGLLRQRGSGTRFGLIADAPLAWSQLTCFDGALDKAEPKTMLYRSSTSPPSWPTAGVSSSCISTRAGPGGQRVGHRLCASMRWVPIAVRVPTSDPEAIPQDMTGRN
jgi:hypothetical protein